MLSASEMPRSRHSQSITICEPFLAQTKDEFHHCYVRKRPRLELITHLEGTSLHTRERGASSGCVFSCKLTKIHRELPENLRSTIAAAAIGSSPFSASVFERHGSGAVYCAVRQRPRVQVWPSMQTVVQLPQCIGSFVVSKHMSVQSVRLPQSSMH